MVCKVWTQPSPGGSKVNILLCGGPSSSVRCLVPSCTWLKSLARTAENLEYHLSRVGHILFVKVEIKMYKEENKHLKARQPIILTF